MNRREFLKLSGKSALGVSLLAKFGLNLDDIAEAQENIDAAVDAPKPPPGVTSDNGKYIEDNYPAFVATGAYTCDVKMSKELLIDLDYAERFRQPVIAWTPNGFGTICGYCGNLTSLAKCLHCGASA
jgi:hypothetical protein